MFDTMNAIMCFFAGAVVAWITLILIARLKRHQATMAERLRVGVRIGPVMNDHPNNGGINMSLALAQNDRQKTQFSIAPPSTDIDGQPLVNADGTPFIVPVSVSSDNPNIAPVIFDDPASQLSGFIGSGLTGSCVVTIAVGPYQDGSTQTETINVAIGNSSPSPLNVTLGAPIDE